MAVIKLMTMSKKPTKEKDVYKIVETEMIILKVGMKLEVLKDQGYFAKEDIVKVKKIDMTLSPTSTRVLFSIEGFEFNKRLDGAVPEVSSEYFKVVE